jgi:hypothetical protein
MSRKVVRSYILGIEFEIPDMGGDPADPPADPLEGEGASGAAADAGAIAVDAIPTTLPGNVDMPASVAEALPEIVTNSITEGIESIPTSADGTMGQSIQADVSEQLKSNPEQLHDSALHDAIKASGDDPANITKDQLQKAYDDNVKDQITQATDQYKTQFKDAVGDALKDPDTKAPLDPDIDPNRGYDGKSTSIIDQMVDDPAGTEENLTKDGENIEKENPNWKERLKDIGKKLAGYGAKALLVLGLIGAFLPGGSNVIDKLAQMAADAANKVVNVALNVIKTFLGPFIKTFWDLVKKLKVPFTVLGIILIFLLILWIYRQIRGTSS